ncbi:MAG: class I SAM-dependent methyltransferase [Dehalococcoidales bacterium]|nr:class I SAM-dependent methyltransferase [Dehalococcoidales bacterium]
MTRISRQQPEQITEAEVALYWDKNADLWTEQVRQNLDAFREHFNNPVFLQFIGDIKGKTALDAGCGEGHNTRIFARLGAKMTGIDISPKLIAHAREAEKREPLGIRYEVASFSDLSIFPDASFDLALSTMALMDSPSFEGAAREIYRVLKPGSDFFFSITHPCFVTPGFGWTAFQDDPNIKLTVSEYFSKKQWVESWRFSQLPKPEDVPEFVVPSFGRTLSDYINPLIKTGFTLKELSEPRPSAELCRQHPFLTKWRKTAAIFLHVHCRKE